MIVWYYAEKNSFLNDYRKQKNFDENAELIQIVDSMGYTGKETLSEDHQFVLTSYKTISKAFEYMKVMLFG